MVELSCRKLFIRHLRRQVRKDRRLNDRRLKSHKLGNFGPRYTHERTHMIPLRDKYMVYLTI